MATIKIALAADHLYARHAGVLIASILANAGKDDSFHFFLLDGGLIPDDRERLESLRALRPFEIDYLAPNFDVLLKDCPDVSYFSMNAYSRLLLPELLSGESRVLYLDCDMIVLDSLAELWKTNLDGQSLGVVPDVGEILRKDDSYRKRVGIVNDWPFNSGMLLIDLDRVRNEKLFHQTIQWIARHREEVQCPDQEGLNAVFLHDKCRIPSRFNFNSKWDFKDSLSSTVFRQIQEANPDMADAMTRPAIIHYIGRKKPWHFIYSEKNGAYYQKYLALTPWQGTPIDSPKNWKKVLEKKFRSSSWIRSSRIRHKAKLLTRPQRGLCEREG